MHFYIWRLTKQKDKQMRSGTLSFTHMINIADGKYGIDGYKKGSKWYKDENQEQLLTDDDTEEAQATETTMPTNNTSIWTTALHLFFSDEL